MYRVGWVDVASAPPPGRSVAHRGALPPLHVFRGRLAERGYAEGKNIFTSGTKTARNVQEVVKSTPLVVYSCDPFKHVSRLARRGGNVTGRHLYDDGAESETARTVERSGPHGVARGV